MINTIILWLVRIASLSSIIVIFINQFNLPAEIFAMSFIMIVIWISAEYDEYKKRNENKGRR